MILHIIEMYGKPRQKEFCRATAAVADGGDRTAGRNAGRIRRRDRRRASRTSGGGCTTSTGYDGNGSNGIDYEQLTREHFAAWSERDWEGVSDRLADQFTFTTPYDDGLDLEQYRTRRWD